MKLKDFYNRQEKRIKRIVREAKKQGIEIDISDVYKKPKRITYKQANKLYQLTKSEILSKGTKGGEPYTPEKRSPKRKSITREQIEEFEVKPRKRDEQNEQEHEEPISEFDAFLIRFDEMLLSCPNIKMATFLRLKLQDILKSSRLVFEKYIHENSSFEEIYDYANNLKGKDYKDAFKDGAEPLLEIVTMGNASVKDRQTLIDYMEDDLYGLKYTKKNGL